VSQVPSALALAETQIDRRTDGVQVHDRPGLGCCAPEWFELRAPQRHQAVGQSKLDSGESQPCAATQFFDERLGRTRGQTADPCEAIGAAPHELREKIVVRSQCGSGDLRLAEFFRHAEDPVEDLARNSISLLTGCAQLWVTWVPHAARAIVPEATLIHAVESPRFAAPIGLTRVTRAADPRDRLALRVEPELSAIAFHHVRHAFAQARGCPRSEEIERQER
jgi:hypothetical protein